MSADLPPESPDRREYFRIEDRIGLEFRPLSAESNFDTVSFDDGPLKGLRDELNRFDQDVRSQLASLSERDRLLATLFKSLNSKVDLLARIMAFEQNPLQPRDWQPVTLSEGGVSFSMPENTLSAGDQVALRMTLPPELYCPQAIAQVVEITLAEGGNSWVRTEFTQISDSDRQHIARHVLRWQIRQRQHNESSGK